MSATSTSVCRSGPRQLLRRLACWYWETDFLKRHVFWQVTLSFVDVLVKPVALHLRYIFQTLNHLITRGKLFSPGANWNNNFFKCRLCWGMSLERFSQHRFAHAEFSTPASRLLLTFTLYFHPVELKRIFYFAGTRKGCKNVQRLTVIWSHA